MPSVYPQPRIPVTNEGLGWDSLLKMERSWKKVTGTGSGVVPRYTIDMMLGTPHLAVPRFYFCEIFLGEMIFLRVPGEFATMI